MDQHQNSPVARLSREMSSVDFATYGVHELAYVKPVVAEGGEAAFAVHAADGTPLAVLATRDLAFAVVRQNDMEPVSAH
ncbi:MAG TPA: DUF1150 family protein [Alphaproteobacteria bacterium]|nr:DUF1150 family protein [Alphaproteobacteria bacterium]